MSAAESQAVENHGLDGLADAHLTAVIADLMVDETYQADFLADTADDTEVVYSICPILSLGSHGCLPLFGSLLG